MVNERNSQSAEEDRSASRSEESDCASDASDVESVLAIEPHQNYFFGAKLTAEQREHTWDFSNASNNKSQNESMLTTEEDDDAMKHVLKLRQVTLGVGAKTGERNVVELEAGSVDGDVVATVIASLTVGVKEMGSLNLDFDGSIPVTFRLVEGSGPIHIAGCHEMTLQYQLEDGGFDQTAENLEELSDVEETSPTRAAKRRKDNEGKTNSDTEDTKQGGDEEEMEQGSDNDANTESPKPREKNKGIKSTSKSPKDLKKKNGTKQTKARAAV